MVEEENFSGEEFEQIPSFPLLLGRKD